MRGFTAKLPYLVFAVLILVGGDSGSFSPFQTTALLLLVLIAHNVKRDNSEKPQD